MAIDNPTIFCGDDTADLEVHIVETCEIELVNYFEDQRVLTRKIFQKYFGEILNLIESWAPNFPEYNNIAYQLLGALILKLGAKIPDDLRERIIEATDWELDKAIKWPNDWILLRQFYLTDLRRKIKKHKYGQITYLVNLGLLDDKQLNGVSIGLDQYENLVINNQIRSYFYVNLDSSNLKRLPKSLSKQDHIKVLSLNGNSLTMIPEEIECLESLKELYLNYNFIETLPDSMRNLKYLNCLELAYNNLKVIPEFIIDLEKKHAHLNLLCNPIEEIPTNLKRYIKPNFSFMKEKEDEKFNIKWYI